MKVGGKAAVSGQVRHKGGAKCALRPLLLETREMFFVDFGWGVIMLRAVTGYEQIENDD